MPKERKIVRKDVQPGAVESCFLGFENLHSSLSGLFKFGVVSYNDLKSFKRAFAGKLPLDTPRGSPRSSPRNSVQDLNAPELVECYYMLSPPDGSFEDEQFRSAYIFTPKEMFYHDGQISRKIKIDPAKLAELEKVLEITPACKDKSSKVLSEGELQVITFISGHNPSVLEDWEDINISTNLLACIWPNDKKPSWIFVDVNEKKIIVLRKGDEVSEILDTLSKLGYRSQQVVHREINDRLFEELTNKIGGQKEVKLSSEECELATYSVMLRFVVEKISGYGFQVGWRQEELGLCAEEYNKVATYLVGLMSQENKELERFLVSAMRLPKERAWLHKTIRSLFLGDQSPPSPKPALRRLIDPPSPGSSPSPSSPHPKPMEQVSHSPRVIRGDKSPHTPPAPRNRGDLPISPVRPKTAPQLKRSQESWASSPLRTKSGGIPIDSSSSSVWQRLKQRSKRIYEKWKALSLGYKIMAVMAFAIGVSAIVYGCVFCPPAVVLVPLAGSLNVPAIAVIGGTIVAGIASIAHAFHVAFTKVNRDNVGGEENFGFSCYTEGDGLSPPFTPLSVPRAQSVAVSVSPSSHGEMVGTPAVSPHEKFVRAPIVDSSSDIPRSPSVGCGGVAVPIGQPSLSPSSSLLHRRAFSTFSGTPSVAGVPQDITVDSPLASPGSPSVILKGCFKQCRPQQPLKIPITDLSPVVLVSPIKKQGSELSHDEKKRGVLPTLFRPSTQSTLRQPPLEQPVLPPGLVSGI